MTHKNAVFRNYVALSGGMGPQRLSDHFMRQYLTEVAKMYETGGYTIRSASMHLLTSAAWMRPEASHATPGLKAEVESDHATTDIGSGSASSGSSMGSSAGGLDRKRLRELEQAMAKQTKELKHTQTMLEQKREKCKRLEEQQRRSSGPPRGSYPPYGGDRRDSYDRRPPMADHLRR